MKITNVKITWRNPNQEENLKGMANITLENSLVINGIKIFNGKKGLFISMPQIKNEKKNEYNEVCFPITKEFREYLSNTILEDFNK